MPVLTTYRHPKAISLFSPRWSLVFYKQFKFNQVHSYMNRANRLLPLALLALLSVGACQKPEQPKPDPKQAISIPTQSQAVFDNGISFPTPSGQSQSQGQPQTQTVTFTTTESWTSTITDTKSSTWLTVEPSSGGAGTVNMTVKAQPNDTDKARSATVTIKSGSTSKSFTVTQAAKAATTIAVTSVELNKTELRLPEGGSETLEATVKPDNATDKTVTWSTSDTSIATVDANGKVTAVKEGTATITAKAGEKTATCNVTVSKDVVSVMGITLNKTELVLNEGSSETLVATVSPEDATDKHVTWSTSDSNIATVDNGKVTAVKEGTATITAKAGEKSATCKVTVSKNIVAVSGISLNKKEIALNEGASETLVATVKPDNATDKTITWSTSDANIAKVDNGKVTAVKVGTTTITAQAGEKSATCKVTVSKDVVAITEIALNKTALYLYERESETLKHTIYPSDATDTRVTWRISNPTVAIVDSDGTVTAIKAGVTEVTAEAGSQSATCKVIVSKNVSSVELDKISLNLMEGDSETLTATLRPKETANWKIWWSSSDESIVQVNAAGAVTAVKEGSAVITAKAGASEETMKSASCEVKVRKGVSSISLDLTNLVLSVGESRSLTATVDAELESDKQVTWASSNPLVATVDTNGKVTAVSSGQTIVWASAGNKEAKCWIYVREVIPVASVTLNKSSLTLGVGASDYLQATISPVDHTSGKLTWSSSDPTVASVDIYGYVTALKAGTTVIEAECGGKAATCTVTVVVWDTHIRLNKISMDLFPGESETLVATVYPENATDKSVRWVSDDPSIASVDATGRVTGVGVGSVRICAYSRSGYGTVCYVNVNRRVVTDISLNKTYLSLVEDESETLFATVTPNNAEDKTVTWSSDNTSVATVDANGLVTALHEGVAYICAQAGSHYDYCRVEVRPKVPPVVQVTSITLNKSTLTLELGESETLIATVYPENAADKSVWWRSTDESVARVDNQGRVTGYKAGQARIYAQSGQYDVYCVVTVTSEGLGENTEGFVISEGEW